MTIQPQATCGTCYSCRHGAYHICDSLKVMGFQTTGAGSEFFAVDASKVLKLPAGMSLDFGAMVEPAAVAVHAIGRHGEVKGRRCWSWGRDPSVTSWPRPRAAWELTRSDTDVSDFRLEKAKECGITARVNVAKADLAAAVREHLGEEKADLILECVGTGQTISQAVAVARKGTDIIVVGVFGSPAPVDLGTVQDRELRLIGTLMYKEPDWKTAIDLIQAGKINLAPLITDRFAFADYVKAYDYIEANRERAMKVMIEV